jgi:hypothetical protein
MTSERMIASNRINGRHSRGPHTAAGKASSRRNALQHGLAVRVLNDTVMCSKVEVLARIIAGASADEVRLGYARIIAEAQCDLDRIQYAKVALLNSYLGQVMSAGESDVILSLQNIDRDFDGDDLSGEDGGAPGRAVTLGILQRLCSLQRYEDRAISRRRRAMRALVVLQPLQMLRRERQ